jgi:hypothetical protein
VFCAGRVESGALKVGDQLEAFYGGKVSLLMNEYLNE